MTFLYIEKKHQAYLETKQACTHITYHFTL